MSLESPQIRTNSDHGGEDGTGTSKKINLRGGDYSKAKGVKCHFRKLWWAWLLGMGLSVMIVMLIRVYAILPRVAQSRLDHSALNIESLSILSPTPNSFRISITSSITGVSTSLKARLESFNVTLDLASHPDSPTILELPLPEITTDRANIPLELTSIPITIPDVSPGIDAFAQNLLANDKLDLSLHGHTKMWIGALQTKVNYNELVSLRGLNGLQRMAIKDYQLVSDRENTNIVGRVLIPNLSVVTLEMGDVNLQISTGNTPIGTGMIPRLILRPGNHSYEFNSLVPQDKLLQLASIATSGGEITVASNGTSVGGLAIPWLSKPLGLVKTKVPFQLPKQVP